MYLFIATPPLYMGLVKLIIACAFPAIATTFNGLLGGVITLNFANIILLTFTESNV